MIQAINQREEGSKQDSAGFLIDLFFNLKNGMLNVLPKRLLTFSGLHR
jgi:hypothetical protein